MSVEFVRASTGQYQEIADFLHSYWAENHAYTRDRRLFEWTFRNGYRTEPSEYSIMLARESGQIVGMLGGIPFELTRMGQKHDAVWIVNYVMRPDQRRGATALKLMGTWRGDPYAATIAFGINPATAAVYQVLHGEVLPPIPRYLAVLPGCAERMASLIALAQPEWDAARVRDLAASFETAIDTDEACALVRELPRDWDEKSWPKFEQGMIGASRSASYLDWRYLRHPAFSYRILTAAGEESDGLLIWRLEEIRHKDHVVDRIGRIVEFMPTSQENARLLLAALARDLQSCYALGADYYSYHGPTGVWIRACGMRSCQSHPDGESLPARFQPLDGRGGGIMAAMFRSSTLPALKSGDDCAWYWTKSDSDQDRPR